MFYLSKEYIFDARVQNMLDYQREIYLRFGIIADDNGIVIAKDFESLARLLYPERMFPMELLTKAIDTMKRAHLLWQTHDAETDVEKFYVSHPGEYWHTDQSPFDTDSENAEKTQQ